MTSMEGPKIKHVLVKYKYPDTIRRQLFQAMSVYSGLRSEVDKFVFNDGNSKELLNLIGTIPVLYKGNTYNIPMCIWLMDTHPNNAPMCYVKPTSDMQIRVSKHVDHNGKIYLPYLHDWHPSSSDLMGLIQVMIMLFAEQPPVFAKPTPYPTQSFMPIPGGGSNIGSTNYPPYPQNSHYATPNNVYQPPYPTSGGSAFPFPNYGGFGNSPSNFGGAGYPGGYPPAQHLPTLPSPTVSGNSGGNSGTITEEHIRASLLSAIEDKMRRRLREQFSQLQAELETLRKTQQELSDGSSHLSDLFDKLKAEQLELEKNIGILQDKETELEKEISKLGDNQSIDVDEAVTTTAPLYKQMLNAFVEEAAIEDAVYYLAEGLRGGIIDLEAFLKQVRQLSRRQFMLRALMQRCRQKAGLAG